jgi:hypothetical protein
MLDLYCWALDDDPLLAFPIKIAKSETVGGLKDAIKDKKKPEFDHVAADRLNLWKVSIPDDRSLKENISKLDFYDEQSLSPTAKLSKVFADAPEEMHLHIVVRAPPAGELDIFLHE